MILKKYPILHTQVSNLGQKYLKIHFWPKYFTLELNILNQNRTADFLCVLKFLVNSGTHGTVVHWSNHLMDFSHSDLSLVHFWYFCTLT